MTKTKRITYLDMARGIGMLLVVMGHIEYINRNVRQFITAFHMPLFFLISGILICEKQEEEKNFIELAKKKLRSIMVPYVIFSLLSFCIEGTRIAIKGLDEWNVVFRQLFQSCCLQGVSTLWFLPALFMSELVFVGIRKKASHVVTIVSVGVITVSCAILSTYEKMLYQNHADSLAWGCLHDVLSMLLRNFFCVGFICTGYYVGKGFLKKINRSWQEIVCIVVFSVISFVTIIANMGVDLRYMQIHSLPLYLVESVAGAMMVIFTCKWLTGLPCRPLRRVFEYYGRNSLIIMVTHMDFRILYCSIKLATILQAFFVNHVMFCFLIVLFVFLMEIPIIWFVNRFLPFMSGKTMKSS